MEHVPVVVLDDGTAFILLMEEDLARFPVKGGIIPVSVERVEDILSLWFPGRFEPTFAVDKEAELAIRKSGTLGVRILTPAGQRESGLSLDIQWPVLGARYRRIEQ